MNVKRNIGGGNRKQESLAALEGLKVELAIALEPDNCNAEGSVRRN
jgi:hypothetical protein